MLGPYVKTLSQVCPGGSSAYRQLKVAQILQNRWRAWLSFPQRFPLFPKSKEAELKFVISNRRSFGKNNFAQIYIWCLGVKLFGVLSCQLLILLVSHITLSVVTSG